MQCRTGDVIFDDGDEVVVGDPEGMPTEIVVADHTSTFGDYRGELEAAAPAYARAVNRRAPLVPDPAAFAQEYLEGFRERFTEIQRDYLARSRAFERLFRHRQVDPAGNLAFRWKLVLARLAQPRSTTWPPPSAKPSPSPDGPPAGRGEVRGARRSLGPANQ